MLLISKPLNCEKAYIGRQPVAAFARTNSWDEFAEGRDS